MKIAIVLAICVIFTSVIYATEAQAELDNLEMVATLQFGVSSPQVYPMIGTVSVSESIFSDIVFAQYSREGDFTDIDVKGKIVLAQRGGETASESVFFTDKEIAAVKNGAVGLIIYNNVPGIFFGELTHANVGDDYTPSIPVVAMSQKDGLQIRKELLQSHNPAIFNVSPKPELDVIPEPIPELIFEGGEFTFRHGSEVVVPVQIKITNHNHKIIPVINTIYENKIIHKQKMLESHSGKYDTFLNIDGNYAAGEYFLQLEYDGKKLTPIPFKVMKEFDEKKSSILGKGEYAKKIFDDKESYINLSEKHFDIYFSSTYWQEITGEIDNKGKTGKLQIFIDGPKSMIHNVALLKTGIFMSELIVDKEWPTGTYKVSGLHRETQFATNEFTIKNYNKDSLLKGSPISGTLKLDVVESNQYSILQINGKLDGQSLPERIGIRISQEDVTVDVSYLDVKQTGEFETSLVLYDYVKKSNWTGGTYDVEIVNSGTLEPYKISSIFKITEQGTVIADLEQGMKISTETGMEFLELEQTIAVDKYNPKEINIFGMMDDYVSGMPVEISLVTDQGEMMKMNVLATKDGQYTAPILINEEWNSGHYDVFVNHNGDVKNVLSFNIAEVSNPENISEDVLIDASKEISRNIERFNIIQKDGITNEFVNIKFSTTSDVKRFEMHEVTLEKPDGSYSIFKVRTDEKGTFSVPVIIENSWMDGVYKLSSMENQEKIQFGEFSITKQSSKPKPLVLGEILETANPEKNYQAFDNFLLGNNQITISRGSNTHLDVSGQVSNYEKGDIEMHIQKGDKIISEYKIKPALNGKFKKTIIIDDSLEYGFYEINTIYDDRKFGISEILIVESKIISSQFGTKPIQISRDMFVESGGELIVKLSGWIKDYKPGDSNYIVFTILNTDGTMETFEIKSMRGGYFTYKFPINSEWQNGTYVISAEFKGKKIGHTYLQITDFDVKWIKNYTEQWTEGDISTHQYVNRINTAIENKVLDSDIITGDVIPEWVKITANSWIDGKISQKEFAQVIKFLE